MSSWRRLALALALLPPPAAAQLVAPGEQERVEPGGCYRLVREIAFEGNETTQPRTMLREMIIEVGDPAEPVLVEKSRQGISDLGLFKRVEVREELVPDGVRLVYVVDERYYLLPLPRLDIKSDGQYSYGGQVRWANVFGLNHSLRASWVRADRKRKNIGEESIWSASYSAPFVFESPYGVSGGAGYTSRPVEDEVTGDEYTETFSSAYAGVSRALSDGPASQGWTLGGGLTWTSQHTEGPLAPRAYGTAIAPNVSLGFRDFHYRIYSDIGVSYGTRFEFASEALGSDYHFSHWTATYANYRELGSAEHQTLHLIGAVGAYFGGPASVQPFGLGGSGDLRGYASNFIEGDAYYLVQVEAARPIWRRWLRGVVILEAGNVFNQAESPNLDDVYASLGIGLRVRFTNFVNFEMEAGYAIPLTGGSGRLFASRV